MSAKTNKLRFPSGRIKTVVLSRYLLARRIAAEKDYCKLMPDEEDAATSLISWGMVERHAQTPQYVRWSILHERPQFGTPRVTISLYGSASVDRLSQTQHDLLDNAASANTVGKRHRMLTKNCPALRRAIRGLERRGLVVVTRGEKGVTEIRIADNFPGRSVKS